ncbi:MAG: hypothetical protein KGH61_03045 [Candidatus Micrarchaeota archaeon]|nr:hypothetical protein [Candidatus Micrarchaeota archaeon]MDE1847899.1 hypothetical protein [Candidatus Micrarchaeota archaeon]MDE1864525.1 hypothetical protein [Candidatus Micrarchaeota archaeon]
MKLGQYFERFVHGKHAKEIRKTYLCWKCGVEYVDPVDYLWHIKYC